VIGLHATFEHHMSSVRRCSRSSSTSTASKSARGAPWRCAPHCSS